MNIIGHQKIINYLNKSIEKDTLAQAYLFSGPEHVGKFSAAMDFARKLAGGSGINPDIIVVAPEIEEKKGIIKKKDIKIEQIRDLQKELAFSPYFGKHKVAVIDDADRLTIGAQNAMLKTLEEPNEKNIIILIVQSVEKILPTIKSRCVIKKFNLVGDAEIAAMVGEEKNKEETIFWSLGRPGLARILLDEPEKLLLRKKNDQEFKKLFSDNVGDRFALVESLSKDVPSLIEKMDLWLVLLRGNILRSRKTGVNISPEKSLRLIENIGESLKVIKETNANARLVLENMFLNF